METRALEVLYIQYGTPFADFSVGHFQMKPSFAESIEADLLSSASRSVGSWPAGWSISDSSGVSLRTSRLLRLKSTEGQLWYLRAFMNLVHDLFPSWDTLSPEIQLRYYATAYQGGYHRIKEEIESAAQESYFFTGLPIAAIRYSYSDISAFYYRSCKCR